MGFTALIAGGIGGVGSIGSSLIGANASKTASNAQVQLGEEALAQQKALFNLGLEKQSGYFQTAQNTLSPFINAGTSVLPNLRDLLTPGPNQNALLSQTPGFQFANQYGLKAATNALASRGLGASAGPVATAASTFSSGLASNTWQSVVNALQGYAGLGGNAAASLAGIAGGAGNADVGAGIQAGNSQANTLTNIGQSKAAGILGSSNAFAGGLNSAAGAGSNALLFSKLFNNGGGNGLYSANGGSAYQNSTGNYLGMTDAQQDALQDTGFNLPE